MQHKVQLYSIGETMKQSHQIAITQHTKSLTMMKPITTTTTSGLTPTSTPRAVKVFMNSKLIVFIVIIAS